MPSLFDGFVPGPDDPKAAEHALLTALLQSLTIDSRGYFDFRLGASDEGAALAKLEGPAAVRAVSACLQRIRLCDSRVKELSEANEHPEQLPAWAAAWQPRHLLQEVARSLLRRKLPFSEAGLKELLQWITGVESSGRSPFLVPYGSVVRACEHYLSHHELASIEAELELLLDQLREESKHYKELHKYTERIAALLGAAPRFPITPGEAWADRALSDLDDFAPSDQAQWAALLNHCLTADGGRPKTRWLEIAAGFLETLGSEIVVAALLDWLPLIDAPRTRRIETWADWEPDPNLTIQDRHADLIKGLIWCTPILDHPDLARCLGTVAVSAFKKVRGIGPRAVKIGNACVYALGALEGEASLAALAVLKVRVKFGTAQKGISKALANAAKRAGVTPEELQEIGVPAFGMEEVGLRREKLGDYTAELAIVDHGKTALRFIKPDGKPQKSVPKAVKETHAGELKELKLAAKDIEKMLVAQRDRLDNLFSTRREWSHAEFRDRYLEHPLVGSLARRLIWEVSGPATKATGAIWRNGGLHDRHGEAIGDSDAIRVRPWHPATVNRDEIPAWREWLEAHEIVQPFKQAHREIYLLTDAERRTETYSNRFAGHIVKQHQFNALCLARGWKNSLRLMVDDTYPPATRHLPEWGLRAEFWVEGAGDEYGVDTNEAGTYFHLATDQVRFYRTHAARNEAHAAGGGYASGGTDRDENHPVRLRDVPVLVLSEVLRDVDLFVGVASVGNDPTWADGGPQGHYADYWQSYSFGELSDSAVTRKAVLERLVPSLKIRDRCRFEGRFLVVDGTVRTYKIHLGSGNILMEPNDEYLCIVPAQSRSRKTEVFLPFEGDSRLSIIVSKALLLAADDKIKDATILSQIRPPTS